MESPIFNHYPKILSLFTFLIFTASLNAQAPFITTWKTDNPGTSNSSSITIPSYPNTGYNYDVDWNNDGIYDELGITDSVIHDFGMAGTYTISIRGTFPRIYFNGKGDKDKLMDIVQWGDIEWRSMSKAFAGCSNLAMSATDAPDLSRVTNLEAMFLSCTSFNSPVEHWDVSNVEKFYLTFGWCPLFNQPLNDWNMSSAISIDRMFLGCEVFNQPLNQWDVSKVTNFGATFMLAGSFNQPIGNWDVSSAKIMGFMFSRAYKFNQDLSSWDVSQVYNMAGMFYDANEFNYPIGDWDVGNVTKMESMFKKAFAFNQDISNWNVSKVASMEWMFASAKNFNSDIGNWDVSNVTDMEYLFFYAESFNRDIGNWNVSKVTGMQNMFKAANSFNQDIGDWDVSSVIHMNSMFEANTAFDQNLGRWNVSHAKDLTRMFNRSTLSTENYDSLLIGWNRLDLQPNLNFHGGYSTYCAGRDARANMIASDGWTISDAGSETGPPIARCKDIEVSLDQDGLATISPDILNNHSTVSCGEITLSASQTSFDCSDIGTIPVSLTVEDIHGDSSQCIANIQVKDAPFVLHCPASMTVSPNTSNCSAIVNWEEPEVNCLVGLQSDFLNGSSFSLGTTMVHYTADNQGALSTCSFEVNVVSDLTVQLDSTIAPYLYEKQEGQAFISISGGQAPYQIDWDIDGFGDYDDSKNLRVSTGGKYTAIIKDANDCIDSLTVELNEAEIPCKEFTFDIYPNPSFGTLYLDILSCEDEHTIELYDIRGRQVYTVLTTEVNNSIKFEGIAAGTYILRVWKDKQFVDKRLIVIDGL